MILFAVWTAKWLRSWIFNRYLHMCNSIPVQMINRAIDQKDSRVISYTHTLSVSHGCVFYLREQPTFWQYHVGAWKCSFILSTEICFVCYSISIRSLFERKFVLFHCISWLILNISTYIRYRDGHVVVCVRVWFMVHLYMVYWRKVKPIHLYMHFV